MKYHFSSNDVERAFRSHTGYPEHFDLRVFRATAADGVQEWRVKCNSCGDIWVAIPYQSGEKLRFEQIRDGDTPSCRS